MSISKTSLTFSFEEKTHHIQIENVKNEDTISFEFISKEQDRRNLFMLMNRPKGTLFRCDEEGNLQEIKGLKGRISFMLHRTSEQQKVKECIKNLLKNLDVDLKNVDQSGAQNFQFSEVHAMVLERFFNSKGTIGRLSVFDDQILDETPLLEQYILFHAPFLRVRLKPLGEAKKNYRLDTESSAITTLLSSATIDLKSLTLLHERNIFNISLDETLAHNIYMIFSRKQAEKLIVDSEGKLQKATSFKGRIKLFFNKTAELEKMQAVVSTSLKTLETLAQSKNDNQIFETFLREYFIGSKKNIGTLSKKIFHRWEIETNSTLEKILSYNAENHSNPLLQLRQGLKEALKNLKRCDPREYDKHREAAIDAFTKYTHAEFEFAKSLGIDLKEAGGGSGGARFGFHRFHQKEMGVHGEKSQLLDGKVFVIKPGDEGPHGANNPQWYAPIKKTLISPKRCLLNNSEPLAEVHSYLMDKTFKMHIVPPTFYEKVKSSQFHGQSTKDCSLQMFVEKSHTLATELGISENWKMLPRWFLRWYFNREKEIFGKKKVKEEIENKLPKELLEKVAAHNFLIEDIDCHFGNIMVKQKTASHTVPQTLLNKDIFLTGANDISDQDIDNFVNQLFSEALEGVGFNQLFLQETFDSKDNTIIIKHDGGASHPQSHPTGHLSLRFKHLFEVLPQFNNHFSASTKTYFAGKDDEFLNFLLEKTENELANIIQVSLWQGSKNDLTELVQRWAFDLDETENQTTIIDKLIENTRNELTPIYADNKNSHKIIENELRHHRQYYQQQFTRIRGTIKTRMDSWKVLIDHLSSDTKTVNQGKKTERKEVNSMRDLLLVRSNKDFAKRKEQIKASQSVKRFNTVLLQKTLKKFTHVHTDN